MREYGHMDILIWALASIGLDIVNGIREQLWEYMQARGFA
jgi:hypothetical protein